MGNVWACKWLVIYVQARSASNEDHDGNEFRVRAK